jgi:hypothetical protein
MFGNTPSIKHLNPFGAKCYGHVSGGKQIRTSKQSPRGIKCYVISYTESSKIFRLYNHHKHRVFTSRDIVFPNLTKHLESIEIKSPADLPFDLDNDASWIMEEKRDS